METPTDILIDRLGKLADGGLLDSIDDYTAVARDIGEELTDHFAFIGDDEINAVEIDDSGLNGPKVGNFDFQAGTGPETIRANSTDNPQWLYNSAVHALALFRHVNRLQQEQRHLERLKEMRPAPGVYRGGSQFSHHHFTIIVPEDQRILIPAANGEMNDLTGKWDAAELDWVLQMVDLATGTLDRTSSIRAPRTVQR